jgi:IS30 family transposase
MKLKVIEGGLSIQNDKDAMERLTKRIEAITDAIDLFNESDWQMEEVAMWLQYEKDLAIVESKLYQESQERQQ